MHGHVNVNSVNMLMNLDVLTSCVTTCGRRFTTDLISINIRRAAYPLVANILSPTTHTITSQ